MFSHALAMNLLRYSLGVVFIWFGVLKLFNASPDLDVLKIAMPAVLGQSQLFFLVVSILEILIGIGLFLKRTIRFTVIVMILVLIVITVAVLLTQGFDPRFPILSLAGEFALKNLVLIAAGLVLLTEEEERLTGRKVDSSNEPKHRV